MTDGQILWTNGKLVRAHVEHTATSRSWNLRPASLYDDYGTPPIIHRLDMFADCDETGICGCGLSWCENSIPVARLLVNEFPVQMLNDSGEGAALVFDACEVGPSYELGAMVESLDTRSIFDLDCDCGSVLHLQNLEVRHDLRRQGLGTALVQYAIALLGRGSADLVICETQRIAAPHPPLFPDEAKPLSIMWSSRGEVVRFVKSVGFRRWQGRGMAGYYMVVDNDERRSLLRETGQEKEPDGPGILAFPANGTPSLN